jgi:PleD family two-component response regulator
VFPQDATDVYALIRQADQVLFTAKRAGKNTVRTTADLLQLPLESGG